MTNQKFSNISTESKVDSRFIIFWIILAFLIIGSFFAYKHWWSAKEVPLFSPVEEKKIEVKAGTTTLEEWGAMKKIKNL